MSEGETLYKIFLTGQGQSTNVIQERGIWFLVGVFPHVHIDRICEHSRNLEVLRSSNHPRLRSRETNSYSNSCIKIAVKKS